MGGKRRVVKGLGLEKPGEGGNKQGPVQHFCTGRREKKKKRKKREIPPGFPVRALGQVEGVKKIYPEGDDPCLRKLNRQKPKKEKKVSGSKADTGHLLQELGKKKVSQKERSRGGQGAPVPRPVKNEKTKAGCFSCITVAPGRKIENLFHRGGKKGYCLNAVSLGKVSTE